jgi:protein associated with RNAse G/E
MILKVIRIQNNIIPDNLNEMILKREKRFIILKQMNLHSFHRKSFYNKVSNL